MRAHLAERLGAWLRCEVGPNSEAPMNGIIYLVGLVVVVLAILSFLGLR
jgi:hypothetical protein